MYEQTDIDDLRLAQSDPASLEGQAALDRLLENLADYMICVGMSFLGRIKPADKDYAEIVGDAVGGCYDRLRHAIATGGFVHSSSAPQPGSEGTGGNGEPEVRKNSRLHTYVYRAIVNACRDVLKARGRLHGRETNFSGIDPEGDPDFLAPSGDADLPKEEDGDGPGSAQANVCRGLAAMMAGTRRFRDEARDGSDAERLCQYRVFQMRSQLEASYGEIAERLGITQGNARVKLHRARQQVLAYAKDYLRTLCGGDPEEADALAQEVFASLLGAKGSDGREHVHQFMEQCFSGDPDGLDGAPGRFDEDWQRILKEAYETLESHPYRVVTQRLASRSSGGQTT